MSPEEKCAERTKETQSELRNSLVPEGAEPELHTPTCPPVTSQGKPEAPPPLVGHNRGSKVAYLAEL